MLKARQKHQTKKIFASFILLIFIFIGSQVVEQIFSSKMNHLQNRALNAEKQVFHIQKLKNITFQRNALTLQMLLSDDAFKQDTLNLDLLTKALTFITNRQNLLKLTNDLAVKSLIKETFILSTNGNSFKRRLQALVIEGNKKDAIRLFTKKGWQVQSQLASKLTAIETLIIANEKHALQQLSQEGQRQHQTIIVMDIILVFAMLTIAVLVTRSIRINEHKLENHFLRIEDESYKLTRLQRLDSYILSESADLVALALSTGQIIRTNSAFSSFFNTTTSEETFNLWNLLANEVVDLTNDDVTLIKTELKTSQQWRQDATLISDVNKTFALSLKQVSLESTGKNNSIRETGFILSLSDITEMNTMLKTIEHQANHDSVTELPNRFKFKSLLKSTIQDPEAFQFALIYIDLDNFKVVNDTYGHPIGDALLKQVSDDIQTLLVNTPHDITSQFCRIGGDEFALIISSTNPELHKDSIQISKEIIAYFNTLTHIKELSINIGSSMGIAFFPMDGRSSNDLMSKADLALYHVKNTGKNNVVCYSPVFSQDSRRKKILEENINLAIENKEFSLHFQPKYTLSDMSLCGAEALIRWITPTETTFPDEFIPFAEENGQIMDIDCHVLDMAFQQISDWNNQSLPTKIAINLSTSSIDDNTLASRLSRLMNLHNVPANALEIEITEHSMASITDMHCPLKPLKDLGIEVSVDDFGTGYSSLAYLKNSNIDRIKIDKSFIDDIESNPDAYAIVETIIMLGHKIGAKVLAEGIETKAQLEILQRMNCDEGQGYYMSTPLIASEYTLLLKQLA